VWDTYYRELQGWAEKHGVGLPVVPEYCEQSYHLFYLVLPTLEQRDALMGYLMNEGILSVFHYLPLHLSQMGERFGGKVGDCPVTESVGDRLLRLPFYNSLSLEDQEYVIKAVCRFSP
jgi:dTDP-4-amino-4,6-dideoxygalactose transaminase